MNAVLKGSLQSVFLGNGPRVGNRQKGFTGLGLVEQQRKSLFNEVYLNILRAEDIRWVRAEPSTEQDNKVSIGGDNKSAIRRDNKAGTGRYNKPATRLDNNADIRTRDKAGIGEQDKADKGKQDKMDIEGWDSKAGTGGWENKTGLRR